MICVTFIFFNMNSSLTIYVIDLKFSMCILKVHSEGSVSQILDLGPSFHFMSKNG